MKELSIEQKARAYDKALEIAKDYYKANQIIGESEENKVLSDIFPELAESEDERIANAIKKHLDMEKSERNLTGYFGVSYQEAAAWLEKQGEQKSTQGIEPFEAEHGKYYYCIKDYFCGGKKQASKCDVVQALRGLPIMGLKDASEYFLPVNFIKCKSAWSEDDDENIMMIEDRFSDYLDYIREDSSLTKHRKNTIKEEVIGYVNWLKSLKQRNL